MKVTQLCLTLSVPMDYTVHRLLQARILEWVVFPSAGDLSNPRIEPRSRALQVDSLPAEPPGKPKNTGVGSPSLLKWIFLTQESNWGLLHCRWILYQLSHRGSPLGAGNQRSSRKSSQQVRLRAPEVLPPGALGLPC